MSKITVTGHTGRDIVFESEYGHCMISQEVEIIDAPSALYGYEEQDIVLVSDLHVRPEYRRKGHGRVLLRAAIAYAKRKFPHLPLKIAAVPDFDGMSLEDLVDFYASEGFETVETDPVVCMEYRG